MNVARGSGATHATRLERSSLVLAPLLLATADLFHPPESMDAAGQVAIIAAHATRWYSVHLVLLIGMLVFIPGLLALSRFAAERHRSAGYAVRIMTLVGVAAMTAAITLEMLFGKVMLSGSDTASATALVAACRSGGVLGALLPGVLLFFAGLTTFALVVVRSRGPGAAPAAAAGFGALLILAEILLNQVVLSQIGNILVLAGCIRFAGLMGAPAAGIRNGT